MAQKKTQKIRIIFLLPYNFSGNKELIQNVCKMITIYHTKLFMKKNLALFVLFFALLGATTEVQAQVYGSAIGVNLGVPVGLNYKQFTTDRFAFEGILGYYGDLGGAYAKGFEAILLAEWHAELFTPELNFIYGAGAHIGTYNGGLSLGADGVFGLEYTIANAPISFSFTAKPAYGWLDNGFSFLPGGAFALRYILR